MTKGNTKPPIFGVSFSLHRCSELGIDKKATLEAALQDLGFRRLRLMSYWNIHEAERDNYNFDELDWQMDMAAEFGAKVSLCLGKRQPRWPECHMPAWANLLETEEWYQALHQYIEVVVKRYKDHPALDSWQLENEALLKDFGYCPDQDYNRSRLESELRLIKKIDPDHPVIMTLSDSYGVPFRKPRPDIYAMSLYRITINKKGRYAYSKRPPWFYRIRAHLISLISGRPVFIHELQAEPWLARSIGNVELKIQLERMNENLLKQNINYALKTGMWPIDVWGLEWWYWLKTVHNRPEIWNEVKAILRVSYQ